MKKSKIILAVVLAAVLLVTSISVPTFSWFTRPKTYNQSGVVNGDALAYDRSDLGVYNANGLTVSTKISSDGYTYGNTVTNYSGSDLGYNGRNYFRTTITNNTQQPQNVSLYISTLSFNSTNNGSLCIGVNGPTRNYRQYDTIDALPDKTDRNWKRIYFQPKVEKDKTWNVSSENDLEVFYGSNDTSVQANLHWLGWYDGLPTYYADVYADADNLYFHIKNTNEGYKRTQEFQDLMGYEHEHEFSMANCSLFTFIEEGNGYRQNEYGNFEISCHKVHNGVNIRKYYKSLIIPTGETFDASLISGTDYGGSSIRYYTSDPSVFTVTESGGVITPIAAGKAKLYSKAWGQSYGSNNNMQMETEVTVVAGSYSYTDLPIVKNIYVPADEGNNSVDIDWYAMNVSSTNYLSYTIDDIYLGL